MMIVGSLYCELKRLGFFHQEKCLLISVNEVVAAIQGINIHFYVEKGHARHQHTCNFRPLLFSQITAIVAGLKILGLEDFNRIVGQSMDQGGHGGKLEALVYE
jgi:hypothetical protein